MSFDRLKISFLMTLRMLLRRRIVLLLMAVIPAIFLGVVSLTTPDRPLPFRLASLDEEPVVAIPEEGIHFVFFAVASVGFLLSFLALNLIQKNRHVTRRLILCGYSPTELLISKLAVLLVFILVVASYVGLLTHSLFKTDHLGLFIFSLMSIGFVYGCYGLLVGSLIRGELEGILLIVLLVNIDVGWLQNPLFYEGAQNQEIIRYLPAYFPSQASLIAAFTDYPIWEVVGAAYMYGMGFLLLSLGIYYKTMKTYR
jgi:hypothetical protein